MQNVVELVTRHKVRVQTGRPRRCKRSLELNRRTVCRNQDERRIGGARGDGVAEGVKVGDSDKLGPTGCDHLS